MNPVSPKPTRVYEVSENDDSLIGRSLKDLHREFHMPGLIALDSALETPSNKKAINKALQKLVEDLPKDGKPKSLIKKTSEKEFKKLTPEEKKYLSKILRTDPNSLPARILLSIDNPAKKLTKDTIKDEIKKYKEAIQDQTSERDLKRNAILVKEKDGKVRQIYFNPEVNPKIDDIKDLPISEAQKDFIKTGWHQGNFSGGYIAHGEIMPPILAKGFGPGINADGLLIDLSQGNSVILYNATSVCPLDQLNKENESLNFRLSVKVDITELKGPSFEPGTCKSKVPITLGVKEFDESIKYDVKDPQVVDDTDYEYIRKEQIIGSIAGIIGNKSTGWLQKLADKIVQNSDLIPQVVDGISKLPESNEEKKKKLEVLSTVLQHTVDHTVLDLTESKEGRIKKLQELKKIDELIGQEIAKTGIDISSSTVDKSKKYEEAINLVRSTDQKPVAAAKVFNLLGPSEKRDAYSSIQLKKFRDIEHNQEKIDQFLVDIGKGKTIESTAIPTKDSSQETKEEVLKPKTVQEPESTLRPVMQSGAEKIVDTDISKEKTLKETENTTKNSSQITEEALNLKTAEEHNFDSALKPSAQGLSAIAQEPLPQKENPTVESEEKTAIKQKEKDFGRESDALEEAVYRDLGTFSVRVKNKKEKEEVTKEEVKEFFDNVLSSIVKDEILNQSDADKVKESDEYKNDISEAAKVINDSRGKLADKIAYSLGSMLQHVPGMGKLSQSLMNRGEASKTKAIAQSIKMRELLESQSNSGKIKVTNEQLKRLETMQGKVQGTVHGR